VGVKAASESGQWVAISTSNFCGPQFAGMWNDIKWHQAQTKLIKTGPISKGLQSGRLWERM
jgi:hypothetical protein